MDLLKIKLHSTVLTKKGWVHMHNEVLAATCGGDVTSASQLAL